MKRFLSLRSLSRTVHTDHGEDDDDADVSGDDRRLRCVDEISTLTVWRKSLLMNCNGFTVIDSHGDLVYRVDNYIGRPEEIILMDAHGKSVLTMRRRLKFGLVLESWFVYEGEFGDRPHQHTTTIRRPKRPIFYIRKNINILNNTNKKIIAQIYRDTACKNCEYSVEGSYTNRHCRVLKNGLSKKIVAETRKKEEIIRGVSYGGDVFQMIVHPGFDPAFAMALILILDQMFS